MTKSNAASVHIKKAMLAFPELHEDGATGEGGVAMINRACFVVDTKNHEFPAIAASLDAAVRAATMREFGVEDVEYDRVPVRAGEDIKSRNGKPSKMMKGKISLIAESIQRPSLFNLSKEEVGPDPDLFYAGAQVYGIIEFVARKSGDKRFLNARLRGMMHIAHGTPLDRNSISIATADEFDIEST